MALSTYSVVKTDSERIPYHLVSSRADYSLVRTSYNPRVMFAINQNGKVSKVAGYSHFTDMNGTVEGVWSEDGGIDRNVK